MVGSTLRGLISVKGGGRRGLLCATGLSLSALVAAPVYAQVQPNEPPLPSHRNIDPNGMDLTSVSFKDIVPQSSIGDPAQGGLVRQFFSLMDPTSDYWGVYVSQTRDNYFGVAYSNPEVSSTYADGMYGFNLKVADRDIVIEGAYDSKGNPILDSNGLMEYVPAKEYDRGQTISLSNGGSQIKYTDFDGTIYIYLILPILRQM